MSELLDKIIEASVAIAAATPPEKIVVLGVGAYKALKDHVTVVYHPEGRIVEKLNSIECHFSLVIPSMNYMLLTREEFEKFRKEEKEFLEKPSSNKYS